MVKFAHMADLHLGFFQYLLKDRRDDFYKAFLYTIDTIKEEAPDFTLLSGDVFHSARPDYESLTLFKNVLNDLNESGIPVLGCIGNHDHTPGMTWSDYFFLDNSNVDPWGLDNVKVYKVNWSSDMVGQAISIKARPENFNILLLHHGTEQHRGKIRQCDIDELAKKFNYVALGHIHVPYVIQEFMFNPGSLEHTSSSDWGRPGGYFMVSVDDDMSFTYKHVLSSYRRPAYKININASDLENNNIREFEPGSLIEIHIIDRKIQPDKLAVCERELNSTKKYLRVKIKNYSDIELSDNVAPVKTVEDINNLVFGGMAELAEAVMGSYDSPKRVVEIL